MKKNDESTPTGLYFLGVLSFFPVLGAIVGAVLLSLGISRYKDRWLIIIGSFGVSISILFFSYIIYETHFSKSEARIWEGYSQKNINKVASAIEVYKANYGVYPDSLMEVRKSDPYLDVVDPLQSRRMIFGLDCSYEYRKIGDKYTLYSVGLDHIPHTADDIYPSMGQDSSRFGLIRVP